VLLIQTLVVMLATKVN